MSKITEITKRILMNKESKIQVKDSVKTKKKKPNTAVLDVENLLKKMR